MIRLFRVRQRGSADWTFISICEEEADDEADESPVPSIISSIIGSALATSPLHVQVWDAEEREWEDLE